MLTAIMSVPQTMTDDWVNTGRAWRGVYTLHDWGAYNYVCAACLHIWSYLLYWVGQSTCGKEKQVPASPAETELHSSYRMKAESISNPQESKDQYAEHTEILQSKETMQLQQGEILKKYKWQICSTFLINTIPLFIYQIKSHITKWVVSNG